MGFRCKIGVRADISNSDLAFVSSGATKSFDRERRHTLQN